VKPLTAFGQQSDCGMQHQDGLPNATDYAKISGAA
jgi:hypothetical protein